MKENVYTIKNYVLDRGNYLRGLLVLISKDNSVHEHEKDIFLNEGAEFGYSKDYLNSSLNTILKNEYILTHPPVFHFKKFAIKFLERGIALINKDKNLHPYKVVFLKDTARANNLTSEWDSLYLSRILPKSAAL